MAKRMMGPKGSTRRRRFLFVPLLLAACIALFVVAGAQAVHDTTLFQLDGNALSSDTSVAFSGGTTTGVDDWDNVCHQVNPVACPSPFTNTHGATAVSWSAEANPSSSIFTGGGSKDPQDISNWAWKDAGGLPDKDNLQHGFAARYSVPSNANCPGPAASMAPRTATSCSSGQTASTTAGTRSRASGSSRTRSRWATRRSAAVPTSTACTSSVTSSSSATSATAAPPRSSRCTSGTPPSVGTSSCCRSPGTPGVTFRGPKTPSVASSTRPRSRCRGRSSTRAERRTTALERRVLRRRRQPVGLQPGRRVLREHRLRDPLLHVHDGDPEGLRPRTVRGLWSDDHNDPERRGRATRVSPGTSVTDLATVQGSGTTTHRRLPGT